MRVKYLRETLIICQRLIYVPIECAMVMVTQPQLTPKSGETNNHCGVVGEMRTYEKPNYGLSYYTWLVADIPFYWCYK